MLGLSGFRLFGAATGAVMLTALIIGAWTGLAAKRDRAELRADIASCARAAEKATESSDRCPEAVKAAIADARQAKQCDVALLAKNRDATRFAIQAACSTAVKTEVAGRTAAEDGQRAAEAEIDKLIADQASIADRAEARGADQAKRKESADDAIKSAPSAGVGSGNRKHCDAGCLRKLTRAG